jgi:hypothetical protein
MLFLIYGTEQSIEEGTPVNPEQMAEMGKLLEDSHKAGIMAATGAAAPKGLRLQSAGGKFTTTDGPFIEVKELTGGFALIQVKSVEEALEWAKRFRLIVGDGESEIVPIYGPSDFGG